MGNSLDKFNDLEESLREERNRIVAQNGNDGLHYSLSEEFIHGGFDQPNNRPKHYDSSKDYDLIDVIRDYDLNFCRGNIIKYVARAGKKDSELKDLLKAMDYLEREIKYLTDKLD